MRLKRALTAAAILAALLGCMASNETKSGLPLADASKVKPPATAGKADTLVGTTWAMGGGQTITFNADGKGTAQSPMGPPLPMGYSLHDNGVITIIVGAASRAGTWDGKELIIDGKPLTRAG